MPILDRTEITGELVYVGIVRNREAKLSSDPIEVGALRFDGLLGECHGGATRASCTRVAGLYPPGTEIRNFRQLSIMSIEEIGAMGDALGVTLMPEWFGVNLVFKGIPRLTDIPPASRLVFDNSASIMLDMENAPCVYAANEIAHYAGVESAKVKAAARNLRGLVGAVEAEGDVRIGDRARLFLPKSRRYII